MQMRVFKKRFISYFLPIKIENKDFFRLQLRLSINKSFACEIQVFVKIGLNTDYASLNTYVYRARWVKNK